MPRHRHTRRQALALGAAALAAGGLRPARAVARQPALFELDLGSELEGGARTAAGGWRTTRVLAAPRRFDMLGLRWPRGSGRVEAQVRARRRGGGWTRWATLSIGGDHGPDGARAPAGTDPAWVGAADLFQLRLRGRPGALRARFVRTQPAARAARRRPARARLAQNDTPPNGTLPIIMRAEWGGDGVVPRAEPAFGQVQLAFVHHTVTANDYLPEQSAGIVLGIARYHRDSNKWNDLGYNFVVDKHGQVFEGRAGGVAAAVVGAHAQGYNSVSTGIACLGTFATEPQSEAGVEALAKLIAWKLSLHGAPVQGTVVVTSAGGESNRYPAGTAVTLERISGHRDGDRTSCPGDALYAQLADLRARAARHAGPLAAVTVRASTSQVRGSRPALLGGTLRFADGSSPAGAAVEILYATGGSAFQRLAGAQARPDGSWSATVVLPQSGDIRARFPGDGARPALESGPVRITVLPTIALGLSARRIRERRAVAVAGVLVPAAATRVEVLVERRVGRRWKREQRRRIAVRGGRYETRVRPRRAGLYRVTVSGPGVSARRRVRVMRARSR